MTTQTSPGTEQVAGTTDQVDVRGPRFAAWITTAVLLAVLVISAVSPVAAAALLAAQGIEVRIVSMPSTSVFDRQDVTYRSRVLPDTLPRIAVEAGVTDFWWKYRCDAVVGIDRYGESAPAGVLFKHFGFTPEHVADTVRAVLAKHSS